MRSEHVYKKIQEISKTAKIDNQLILSIVSSSLFNKALRGMVNSVFDNKKQIADYIYEKMTKNKGWWGRIGVPESDDILSIFEKFNKKELQNKIIEFIKKNGENGKLPKYFTTIIQQIANDENLWIELRASANELSEKAEKHIKDNYLTKGAIFTSLLENLDDILEHIAFDKIISSKITNYDSDSFEQMINNLVKEHLSFIEISGGILGLIAGIALFNLPVFFSIILIVSVIIGSDLIISKQKKKKVIRNISIEEDVIFICSAMIKKDGIIRHEEIEAFHDFYDEISTRYKFKNTKEKNLRKFGIYTADNFQFDEKEVNIIIQRLKKSIDFNYIKQKIFVLSISDNELHQKEREMINGLN